MANEPVITPVTTPVETPVQSAPVVEAAVVAPVAEAAPAAVVEAPAAVEAPQTILAEAIDKSKPVEAPKVETVEAEKVESETPEGKSDEPAQPPVYDAFTFPEGITVDDERIGKFTEILGELEQGGKVDHTLVQQFGQKAVDFHMAEVKRATEALTELYKKSWDRQKIEWKDTFLKDPEIGGNRFQTTVDSALNFIRTHGGTTEQQTEFRNLMETSGLGNHPAVIRLLANAGRAMAEGKPLAAAKPVLQQKSKTETMYGKSA